MSTKYKRTIDPWRAVASFALSSILAIGPVAAPITAFASELENATTEEIAVETETDEQDVTTDTEVVVDTQAPDSDDTSIEIASDDEEVASSETAPANESIATDETVLTTQSNGILEPNTYYDNYGEIWLQSQNAVSYWQMYSEYEDEYYAKRAALQEQRDAGKLTWEQYYAQEDAAHNVFQKKCRDYKRSVSRLIHSSWNVDRYIAYENANRARWGDDPLSADEINEIRNRDETLSHMAQKITGISYNKTKNTLTIKNVNTNDVLYVENLGNDFKINVSGVNKLGGIVVEDETFVTSWDSKTGTTKWSDDHWGAGLSLVGTGSLMVNQSKNQSRAIRVSSGKTAAKFTVGANVSLRLFSDGSTGVASVSGTTSGSWKNALSFKGYAGTTSVKYADGNVAYPLYRRGWTCEDAEDATRGVAALNPNSSDTNTVMCSDKKHVARVSKYHKDQKTGKYVIDEWKVYEATVTEYPNGLNYHADYDYWDYEPGGYDVSVSSKYVRVKNNNGAPAGYSLIKLGTQQATHSYTLANTEFVQTGKKIIVGKMTYVAKKDGTVYLKKAANKKTVTVPAAIKVNGKKLAVTGISAKAFKSAKKCKTIKIKSTKLTQKSVKNSLKGAKKVQTVKVPKKRRSAYTQYFAAGNCGKAVTVK